MAPKLVAEEGILKDLVLSLEGQEKWTLGRDPDACDLVVEDPAVSRSHLILSKTEEGILVENLSDTNPALINQTEISEPQLLSHGDTLGIGSETFRFYETDEPQIFTEDDTPEEQEKEPQPERKPPAPEPEATPRRDSIFDDRDSTDDAPELAEINFDIAETGRWLLKVVSGPNNGAEFAMQAGNSYTIGTDPNSCDVVFHDNSVSRQHARITITGEDKVMVDDMGSRNGTLIDGETLEGKQSLEPNMLVTLGTTSFVIFDREGEMQTIISPLLPQIVRSLQEKREQEEKEEESAKEPEQPVAPQEESKKTMGAFILIAIITGLFIVVGIGTTTLFSGSKVVEEKHGDVDEILREKLAPFPEVRFQFTKSTGKLLLIGHVLTASDEARMRNALNGLPFIRDIDDQNVVIDELLWREINQVLSKDPNWRGIAIHAPKPGQFVISGYLQSRLEAERLGDYLNANFPFLDLLENRIVVEENVLRDVNRELELQGFDKVLAQMNNGELTLAGTIPAGTKPKYEELLTGLKKIPGLRNVRSFVTEQSPQEAIVNITDKYQVSGVTRKGNVNMAVVINGRVLSVGDSLDGRTITSIGESSIILKQGDIIYRIDFNR